MWAAKESWTPSRTSAGPRERCDLRTTSALLPALSPRTNAARMGVKGLWQLLNPVARPVKLVSLLSCSELLQAGLAFRHLE